MSIFGGRRQEPPQPPREERQEPPRPAPLPQPPQHAQPIPQPQQPVGFETVLGANTVIEGILRSSANVRIDGTFSGSLEITGNILVGESAKINADINARNISIAGAVRGNIIGKKVQLLRTGRIWGDIQANALTTEEGAFIDGKIKMMGSEPAATEVQQQKTPPSGTQVTAVMEPIEPLETPQDVISEVEALEEAEEEKDSD